MSARKPAQRVRRIQRAFKQRQRGSLSLGGATVLLVVLGILSVATVVTSFVLEREHHRKTYRERCEAYGGEYVYGGRTGQDLCLTPGSTIPMPRDRP